MEKLWCMLFGFLFFLSAVSFADETPPQAKDSPSNSKQAISQDNEHFSWWPTDASPAPVKDPRGGYWWWPTKPGTVKDLWGNRGYVYLYKVIYNWQTLKDVQVRLDDVTGPGLKPSLFIKRTIKSLKIDFADNDAELKAGHVALLKKATQILKRNSNAHILIAGRVAESDAASLTGKRSAAIEKYMIEEGAPKDRIKVIGLDKFSEAFPKEAMAAQKEGAIPLVIADLEEFEAKR